MAKPGKIIVLTLILLENYDTIVLTKTWLQEGIYIGELLDDRYTIYRKDRNYPSQGICMGGGI